MKHKKLKSAVRVLFLAVVSLILGFNIYQWNARSLTGNVLPMPFGYGCAVVLTGSMEPTIMTDDLIFVRAETEYDVDDIVVYQSGRMLVVHRIVDIDGDMVTTQGDANNVADEPVDISRVKGLVIGQVSGLGAAVRFLKNPVITIALAVAAFLSVEMPYRKEKEQTDEELERIKEEIRRLKEEQEEQ